MNRMSSYLDTIFKEAERQKKHLHDVSTLKLQKISTYCSVVATIVAALALGLSLLAFSGRQQSNKQVGELQQQVEELREQVDAFKSMRDRS